MKIDCSKTVNYVNEKNRMCDHFASNCLGCPFGHKNNDTGQGCVNFEANYPDKAVALLQKWSDAHPQKTYAEDFFEKYPNALKTDTGVPHACWRYIYGKIIGACTFDSTCRECWNRPVEDQPND